MIRLQPDALFNLTLRGDLPGITKGLQGTTGLNGRSLVSITIPKAMPVGLRLYAAAVAIDAPAPLGLVTTNTWAFSIRP